MKSWTSALAKAAVGLLLLGAAFYAGYHQGGSSVPASADGTGSAAAEPVKEEVWTCSMHPQIRQPKFGLCPLCAMDLIPVKSGSAENRSPRELTLSDRARKLASIRTAPVERRFIDSEVRMIGKVAYDETRIGHITAWVPGRIDQLFANYRGVAVKKGEHMASLYSPELITAQTELLQALDSLDAMKESSLGSMRTTAEATVDAVERKLRLFGLTEEQIAAIKERGVPDDHMTVFAPMGGIVVELNVRDGMYVKTGTRICSIADLSQVWVRLEAYESDLALLRYGQAVEFEAGAYPGETFSGRVAFIDPVLDEKTRTAGIRVNVPNDDGRLMPGLFVRAVVRPRLASGGRVLDIDLAGKWISPMHPEVVKDGPGNCDVCGMKLVPIESLGYAHLTEGDADAPLVIPASAPLVTGKRAVVYVAVPGEEGVFEGRDVVLGVRAGDHYLVRKGLEEGERVVVNGAFKLDSAVQILAGPSMMNPGESALGGDEKEVPLERFETPEEFRVALDPLFAAYVAVQTALSLDSFDDAKAAAAKLEPALGAIDAGLLEGAVRRAWKTERSSLETTITALTASVDIVSAREAFSPLSETLIVVARRFGVSGRLPLLVYYCPMAFDFRGARWLQDREGVENPYFGDAMYRCGELRETFSAVEEE